MRSASPFSQPLRSLQKATSVTFLELCTPCVEGRHGSFCHQKFHFKVSPNAMRSMALFHVSACCFPLSTSGLQETCEVPCTCSAPLRILLPALLSLLACPFTRGWGGPIKGVYRITELGWSPIQRWVWGDWESLPPAARRSILFSLHCQLFSASSCVQITLLSMFRLACDADCFGTKCWDPSNQLNQKLSVSAQNLLVIKDMTTE